MSFKDIFKKSFLEGFASTEITTLTVVTALGVACLLALYIFFVYRVVTRKTFLFQELQHHAGRCHRDHGGR